MGSSSDAKLIYGYDIGGDEHGWHFAEYDADAYEFRMPWFVNSDGDGDDEIDGFTEQAEKLLLAEIGKFTETDHRAEGYYDRNRQAEERIGVEFEIYGSYDFSGYVLAAHAVAVEWGATGPLDFAALSQQADDEGWDAKLADAIKALGITPKQAQPGWHLCSMYG